MKQNFMALLLLLSISFTAFGQTIPTPVNGDFVSNGTGAWSSASTWTVFGGGAPIPAISSGAIVPGFGHRVFINSGHTVSVTAAASCRSIIINEGGALINGSSASIVLTIGRTLLPGTPQSELINNGNIGSYNITDPTIPVESPVTVDADKLDIQINNTYGTGHPSTSTFILSGTGNTRIGGLAAVGAGTGLTKTMTITIELTKSLILTGLVQSRTLTLNRLSGSAPFSSVNENYTMNINSPIYFRAGAFSFSNSGGTAFSGGTYTYNINSTLDLSRGTSNQFFIPLPSSSGFNNAATGQPNITTLNVKGKYIMGPNGFSTFNSTAGTNFSQVALNILDGGEVDATNLINANFRATGVTQALSGAYFNITGPLRTGIMKRKLAANATDVLFHIGTPTGYSPVLISNSGAEGIFTVGVINDLTGFNTFTSPITSDYSLKNRFTISASNPASVIGRMQFGWRDIDRGTSFDRTKALSLQKYGATSWDRDLNVTISTVSGSGDAAVSQNENSTTPVAPDPFLVTVTALVGPPAGVIALNANYTISQNPAVLPLTLLSFTGRLNDFSNEVELKWTTTSEVNTKNFEVLESTDGKTFNVIGSVLAKNTSGIHNYGFNTKSNKSGVIYYQLKQIDLDGKFQLSDVIDIKNKGGLLSVYPNPAQKYLTVNIPQASGLGNLSIYSQDGKVVYSKAIAENESSRNVDIESFNPGVYFLIINKGKELSSQKFVKQ